MPTVFELYQVIFEHKLSSGVDHCAIQKTATDQVFFIQYLLVFYLVFIYYSKLWLCTITEEQKNCALSLSPGHSEMCMYDQHNAALC